MLDNNDDIIKWAENLVAENPKKTATGERIRAPKEDDTQFRDFFKKRGFGVNRTFGRAINKGSLHPYGLAADIDFNGKSDDEIGSLVEDALKKGYRVFDERVKQPGVKQTGPHLHFERNNGEKPSSFLQGRYGKRQLDYLTDLDNQRLGKPSKGIKLPNSADDNNVWNEVDKVLNAPASVTSVTDDALWSEVDQIIGKKPGVAPTPTNPVQTPNINIEQMASQVVPEAPSTLNAQLKSIWDGRSPKAALLVDKEQVNDLDPALRELLTPVTLPDGRILFVNETKARNLGVSDYARDFAKLIGKVEDVGMNTGSGQAVVTLGGLGEELNSSIVTTPQAAAKQAALDRAMFPEAAKQEIVSAQDVVKRRQQETAKTITLEEAIADLGAVGDAASQGQAFEQPNGNIDETESAFEQFVTANNLPRNQQSVDQFNAERRVANKKARAEWEAKFKKSPAYTAYKKFIDDVGGFTEFSPESIEAFNEAQQALGSIRDSSGERVPTQDAAEKWLAEPVAQPTVNKRNNIPAKGQPAAKEVSATAEWTGANAKEGALDSAASKLASQIGVDYDLVRQSLGEGGFAEGEFTKEAAERGKKERREITFALDANAVKELQAKQIGRKEYLRQLKEKTKAYEEQTKNPFEASLLAAKDLGITEFKGKPIDDVINEERQAVAEFEAANAQKQNPAEAYNRILQTEGGRLSAGETPEALVQELYAKQAAKTDELKKDVLAQYGSFSKQKSERERIEKEYGTIGDSTRPMARPSEFILNLGREILNLPGQVSKVAGIGADAMSPAGIPPDQNPFIQFGNDWEKRLNASQNKDLKDELIVGDVSKALAQVMEQTILVPFTGGASMALPIAQGAVGQYDEAAKAGATRNQRIWGATVGGLAAVPDALLKFQFLKGLSPAAKMNFLDNVTEKLVTGLAKKVTKDEARRLTVATIGEFLAKAPVGYFGEKYQERLEDVANKAAAKVTYKPELTWKDVVTASPREEQGYEAAGLVGILGAGGSSAISALSTSELESTTDILREAVKRQDITPIQAQKIQAKAQAELAKRGETITLKPIAVEKFTDKKGDEFTLIEDRGEKVLVENEKGGQELRNKDRLTPIDEIQEPSASVEPEKVLPTPEVATTEKVESTRFHEKRPTGMVDEAPLRPETLTGAKERIREIEEQRDTARREAETDPLTGVANRRALDRALPSAEADENTSVIAFDANNFGQINKKVGEKEGDKVLKEMASALETAAKENGGRVFRKGGDEFTILAPKAKAEQIRDRAEEIFGEKKYDGFDVSVSGVVGNTFDEADSQLQTAKAKRKGMVIEPPKGEVAEPKERTFIHETDADFDTFDINKATSNTADEWYGRGQYLQEKGSLKLEQYGSKKKAYTLPSDAKIFKEPDLLDYVQKKNLLPQHLKDRIATFASEKAFNDAGYSLSEDERGRWRVWDEKDNTSFIPHPFSSKNGAIKGTYNKIHGLEESGNTTPRDIFKGVGREKLVQSLIDDGYDGFEIDGELVMYRPEKLKPIKSAPPTSAKTPEQGIDSAQVKSEKTPEQKAVPAKAKSVEMVEQPTEGKLPVGSKTRVRPGTKLGDTVFEVVSSVYDPNVEQWRHELRGPDGQILLQPNGRPEAFKFKNLRPVHAAAKEAQADESLQMKADPDAVSRFQDVQFAHTQTILEGAKSSIKDVEGSPSIELNEEAAELARRVWASAISKDVSPFYGATHTAAQLRRFAREANKWASHYESKGYTRNQVKALRKLANEFLTVANQAHGITYVFDESLPEETHHKMVLDLGGISTEAVNKLKQNPLWESKKFDRLYPNASPKVRAIELAAKLETGQDFWDDVDPKAKEEFLRIVADDIIDRNTVDGVLTLDTTQFERIIGYGSNLEAGDTGGRREVGQVDRDTERTDEPGRETGEGTRDRDTETDRGDGGRTATDSTFRPDGKQKVSQTPKSLRGKADIPVADRTYTGVTNEGQQAFTDQQLDKGVDEAEQWFRENAADNNLNNGATMVVGLNLMMHYGKTRQIDKMNRIADLAVPMGTESAQTVQAMSIVSAFNPEMAAAYAAKVKKQKTGEDLTPEEAARATRIATNLHETAQVDAAAEVALKQAEQFIKDLEKDIEQANESIQTLTNDNQTIKVDLDEAKKTIRNQKAQITRLTNDKPRTPKAALVKDLRKRKDDILTALAEKYGTPSLSMVAWHGSPHTFDKFDMSKIGTGEGAQAYGYGLYFTDKESIAEHYKQKLTSYSEYYENDTRIDDAGQLVAHQLVDLKGDKAATAKRLERLYGDDPSNLDWRPILKRLNYSTIRHIRNEGAKYRVELKPAEDEYLLWDKPLSEQSEKVKKALAAISADDFSNADLLEIYLQSPFAKEHPNAYAVKQARRLFNEGEIEDVDEWSAEFRPSLNVVSELLGNRSGEDFYREIAARQLHSEPRLASEYLRSLGIRGIKYLDGSSRGKGEGNYNYVIFDDADVEIVESFQQAAEDPDLMDWAMLTLAENWSKMSVGEFYNLANQITNGQLTENEVRELHANAVDALRTNRSMDDDQKAAFKTRSEHLRTARKVRRQQMVELFPKNKPESVNKTVSSIIRQGVEGNYSDDAIIFALIRKKHVNPDDAIKEFEKHTGAEPTKEILVDANRLVNDAKRAVVDERLQARNEFNLTNEDIDLIREEQKFNRTVTGKAQRDAAKFYSGLAKTTYEVALQSVVNLRRANLLTGIKTHLRNISSNAMFQTSEEVSRPLAWLADLAASGLTGERTVQGISPKAIAKSFNTLFREDETFKNLNKESGLKIAKNILLHGDTFEGMEKQQHERSVLGEKAGKLGKAFDAYVNKVFDTLGAEDAVFKTYAFRRSLEEQAKTMVKDKDERIELIKNPTNTMVQIASDYADFSTFTNDNVISNWIRGVKSKSPKAAKAAFETLVPYDRTPTNIFLRVVEHTPIGFVSAGKSLKNLKQAPTTAFVNKYRGAIESDLRSKDDFLALPETQQRKLIDEGLQKVFTRRQQQEFARTFGRASMGSGTFALGVFLAAAGLLTGSMSPEADDKEETKEFFKRREAGIENRSLLIPGVGRFVLPDDPVSKILTAGATFYEQMLADRGAPVNSAWNGVKETAEDAMFEQPLLNSSNSMFRTIKGAKAGEFLGGLVGTTLIPTFVSDIAEVGDEKARTGSGFRPGEKSSILNPEFQGRGFRNTLLKRVPVARNYLVDEAQNTVPQEVRGGVLRRMVRAIDIFNTRPATEYQPLTAPDNESYLKSPEGKHSTTDQLVTIIKYAKADNEDTAELEKALRKKVKNAQKMGTFTADEAKRVNDLLGTDFRPNEKASRKKTPQPKPE